MYAQVGLQLTMSTMPAKVYRASLYKVSSPVVCNGMCTSKNEMWIFRSGVDSPGLCLHPVGQVMADFYWETMAVESFELLQELSREPHTFLPLCHGNLGKRKMVIFRS